MKITILSDGEDPEDKLVGYVLRAENEDFKGTFEFYEYTSAFDEFARKLLDFPFKSTEPIKLECSGVSLAISLYDSLGAINFRVSINDDRSNKVEFSDLSIETEMLHRLAKSLKRTDFSLPGKFVWESEKWK